ncbi:MAG: hypothetical protein PHD32_07745 [Eubacteriales bacterium]|nr:hypothetical protein [Eubacteriales bacterium]
MTQNISKWYRLDNAAKLYPAISNEHRGSVFRMSATLREPVDPACLQRAADKTAQRFPTMAVRMRRGMFWYYFENNAASPAVQSESPWLCRPIDRAREKGFLFRVTYYQCRINLELFHSLADGTGAMEMLKSLVFHYLKEKGYPVSNGGEVLDADIPFSIDEAEDSFATHYDPKKGERQKDDPGYQLRGTPPEDGRLRVICVQMDAQQLLDKCHEAQCTLTEYVTAALLQAMYRAQQAGRPQTLPLRVSVPVNLRRFFRSRTLRNFASYVFIGAQMTPESEFADILSQVRRQMQDQLTRENLAKAIHANVQAERNWALRAAPLFMKNWAMRMAYYKYGEKLFTCSFSNLGKVTLPQSVEPYVERLEFLLGLGDINRMNVASCSYGGVLRINFTRAILEPDIERDFCRFLAGQGIAVTVESN